MNRRSRLAAALVLLVVALGCDPQSAERTAAVPSTEAAALPVALAAHEPAAFADPASCAGCHATEQAAWSGSHHDLAMQPASAETVLADFDDASFSHHGRTTRFRRDGERFIVVTEGADGVVAEFDVAYTFGALPLQQYLIAFPAGITLGATWDPDVRYRIALGIDRRPTLPKTHVWPPVHDLEGLSTAERTAAATVEITIGDCSDIKTIRQTNTKRIFVHINIKLICCRVVLTLRD